MGELPEMVKLIIFSIIVGGLLFKVMSTKKQQNAQEDEKQKEQQQQYKGQYAPPQDNYSYLNKVSDYKKGQAQLVEVFGTHCGPCKAQIPHLVRLTQENPNVHVVSVSTESVSDIHQFIDSNPQARKLNIASDYHNQVQALMRHFNLNGVPHAFLFDGQDNLIWHGHPSQVDFLIKKLNAKSGEAGKYKGRAYNF